MNFEGKTALVTGGTRGIGKSIVELLLQYGCNVISTGTQGSFELGQVFSYIPLDLGSNKSIAQFTKHLNKFSQIDILVNNAGINIIEPIDQIQQEHWDRVIQVNLTGAMLVMNKVSKIMKKNKHGGRIVNVSSIFGLKSRVKRNAYSASKAGLIGLTRASALDLAENKILVNALCPGFTLTDMTRSILSKKEMDKLNEQIPLGRFADEKEVANVAVFLCSDLNTYITGQTITVDGGVMIQ